MRLSTASIQAATVILRTGATRHIGWIGFFAEAVSPSGPYLRRTSLVSIEGEVCVSSSKDATSRLCLGAEGEERD